MSGIGRGGSGTLSVMALQWQPRRWRAVSPFCYNVDDTFSIGTSSPSSALDERDYKLSFPFTGKLNKLTIAVDEPMLTEEDKKTLMEAERRASD